MIKRRTEQDHVEMMRHPERWPHSFFLPLTNRHRKSDSAFPVCGLMFKDPNFNEGAPKVYIGTMYFHIEGKRLEDLPVEEYTDLTAVVLAGWEVD